jgi:hypothetical protein
MGVVVPGRHCCAAVALAVAKAVLNAAALLLAWAREYAPARAEHTAEIKVP